MPSRSKSQLVHILVVGDAGTGKSALVETFVTSTFPQFSFPSAYNTWNHTLDVDGHRVKLAIWDSGAALAPELRALSYPGKHVVLFCYDSARESTLVNVLERWMPEVFHHLPDAPYFLVACKADARKDKRATSSMDSLSRSHPVVECSALTSVGVYNVFDRAARLGSDHAKLQTRAGYYFR